MAEKAMGSSVQRTTTPIMSEDLYSPSNIDSMASSTTNKMKFNFNDQIQKVMQAAKTDN
jgi:hypothetical protein